MSSETLALAERGLGAWQRGAFDEIEAILDPDVRWHDFMPGDEWDCNNRADVMRTLRERFEEGFARAPLELIDAGDDVVIAVARPRDADGPDSPAEMATVITFRDGKVVSMQDYRTKAEAIASTS